MPFRYFLDDEAQVWPFPDLKSNIPNLQDSLLTIIRNQGHLFASFDSETTTEETGQQQFRFSSGEQVEIGEIKILGLSAIPADEALNLFNSRPGDMLNQSVLGEDINELLRLLDLKGFVLAKAFLEDVDLYEKEGWKVDVLIRVDEGKSLALSSIELEGDTRTKPSYIARVLGYKMGEPILTFDPEEIERRLMETKAYRNIDKIGLAVDENEKAILRIRAKEEPPGVFDVILGYLPPANPNDSGSIIGNVNVNLLHVLGAGRSFGFKMDRLPGSVSRLEVDISDPYVMGTPFRLAGGFKGFQQDSTYSTRKYRMEAGYRLVSGIESFVSLSREIANPSPIVPSDVLDAASLFLGVGFSFSRLDAAIAPRSGFELLSNIEQGRKVRTLSRPTDAGGSEFYDDVLQQTRLTLYARYYRPFKRRSVFALGLDGYALQSPEYDQSDLFRLGGAKSLRGYNEEQYRGNISARFLLEWRYLLDRTSYFFLFARSSSGIRFWYQFWDGCRSVFD